MDEMIDLSSQTMSVLEIASLTNKRNDNVVRDVKKMYEELGVDSLKFEVSKTYRLNKRESLILVSGYNLKLRAKIIDRWEELEQNKIAATMPMTQVTKDIQLADWAIRRLNLQGSAELDFMSQVISKHSNIEIPSYAIDAPKTHVVNTEQSSLATDSATNLLKEYRPHITTQKFNKKLIEKGYLETLTRTSTKNKDKTKKFKLITTKGLTFGKNVTAKQNQRETQPHWYRSSFTTLLGKVGL